MLVRYGFSDLLNRLNIPSSWLDRLVTKVDHVLSPWERIRLAMEELGPTFVKIGQVVSTRADSLPAPMLESLKQLRNNVKPEPFEKIKLTLEAQLGQDVSNLFDELEERPIGSGSIAQVHRAILKESGEAVALKIQREGIQKRLTADLEILGWLAHEAHERLEEIRPYNFPRVVEQLKRSLMSELDFTHEANYSEIFTARNPFPESVYAPKVYSQFTTERLLVTEFVQGISPEKVSVTVEEKKELALIGGRSVFTRLFATASFMPILTLKTYW